LNHVRFVCLDITNPTAYARYRAGMEPLLAEYGGRFLLDAELSAAHIHPADFEPSRVLLISFPDADTAERFFADPTYVETRQRWFTPAVPRSLAISIP